MWYGSCGWLIDILCVVTVRSLEPRAFWLQGWAPYWLRINIWTTIWLKNTQKMLLSVVQIYIPTAKKLRCLEMTLSFLLMKEAERRKKWLCWCKITYCSYLFLFYLLLPLPLNKQFSSFPSDLNFFSMLLPHSYDTNGSAYKVNIL